MPLTLQSSFHLSIPPMSPLPHLLPTLPVTSFCVKSPFKLIYFPFSTSSFSHLPFLPFYMAPSFGGYTRSQVRITCHCLQVSIAGPLLPNLPTPTLTPPPLHLLLSSGSLSSLRAEVTNHAHQLLSFTSVLQTTATSPTRSSPLPASPTQGLSRAVATNHIMSGSLS